MTNESIKQRLDWVDAMRGFSIIIVVMGHVLLGMGIGGYSSFLSSILLTFRMPLFFFISGFFSFRLISWWNKHKVIDILKRKFQAQILCTIVFWSLYQYVMNVRFNDSFGGYWFTIVLFQMYIFYLVLEWISYVLNKSITLPALLIFSIIGICIVALNIDNCFLWTWLSWDNLCKYLQFFTLGLISSKYKQHFFRILKQDTFKTMCIIGWTICMIIWYNNSIKNNFPIIFSFIHDIAVRYFGLFTVISLFFCNSNIFTKNSFYSKSLKFIGKRTLDIYMLHFLFIPNFPMIQHLIEPNNMIIIQLSIGIAITTAIVSLCLLLSCILRESNTISNWLFGTKH